jgi:hypothetical protein
VTLLFLNFCSEYNLRNQIGVYNIQRLLTCKCTANFGEILTFATQGFLEKRFCISINSNFGSRLFSNYLNSKCFDKNGSRVFRKYLSSYSSFKEELMAYLSPGKADSLTPNLLAKWNETVIESYKSLAGFHSRFFLVDPALIPDGIEAAVSWFGDPAEPAFCMNEDTACKLSDWGVIGRHNLHNEYCEYRVIEQKDGTGKFRPKRVHITTELREYWVCVAIHDPDFLRSMCQSILGYLPTWESLYGVSDPLTLSLRDRQLQFSRLVAGHGNDEALKKSGVPAQPEGSLNRDNVLFMTHPINGLDDLLYIVMFGAKPYARIVNGIRFPATKEQIFRAFGVEHLACRHADPAAATAAHQQAYEGRSVAFSDPLGVYINNFSASVFTYQNAPIPTSWIQFSRGRQRLEFGPSDAENVFLDEITVAEGASEQMLTGGFEVAKRVEVGPLLRIGLQQPVENHEFVDLSQETRPIRCADADICQLIKQLKDEYEQSHTFERTSPRQMRQRS